MLGPEDHSLSMVDEMDDKTNHINMKNERLKEDIQRFKGLIQEYESTLRRTTALGNIGNASFLGNDSFIGRPTPKLRPEVKHEYEMKLSHTEGKIRKLQKENSELTEQIASLKKSLGDAEVADQENMVAKKLRQQVGDLKKLLEHKRVQVKERMQERIRLTDKEMDLKEANKWRSDQELGISQKKLDQQKKLLLLASELKSLQKTEQNLDSQLADLAESGGANMSMVSQLSSKLADSHSQDSQWHSTTTRWLVVSECTE